MLTWANNFMHRFFVLFTGISKSEQDTGLNSPQHDLINFSKGKMRKQS